MYVVLCVEPASGSATFIVGSDACHRGFNVGPEKSSKNPVAAIVVEGINAAIKAQNAADWAFWREFDLLISLAV
jgi:hypothetical protein